MGKNSQNQTNTYKIPQIKEEIKEIKTYLGSVMKKVMELDENLKVLKERVDEIGKKENNNSKEKNNKKEE